MSDFLINEDRLLKEKYYYKTSSNGLRVVVIPKKFPTEFACIGVNFGGRDSKFEKDGKIFSFPLGCAHFLEHKMFENEDGTDALADFDAFGGNANAFTSFDSTCFYFSCTENFNENLSVLLKCVTHPHFTKESVEREKKIISEEILMYEDSPNSKVSMNLMKAMCFSHPVREPLAGTVRTISEITADTLYNCYDAFYVPSNMVLAVSTSEDPGRIMETVEKYFTKPDGKRPLTLIEPEKPFVKQKFISEKGITASPLFCIGFKGGDLGNGEKALKKAAEIRTAVSMAFGRSSDFYCNNYEKGELGERFSVSFEWTEGLSYFGLGGSCKDPEKLLSEVIEEIEYRKKNFFDKEAFAREKKASYAGGIMLFDSIEDTVISFVTDMLSGFDEFECIKALREVTFEGAKTAFDSLTDTEKCSLSIIYPNS